jgi:hypothetical protein
MYSNHVLPDEPWFGEPQGMSPQDLEVLHAWLNEVDASLPPAEPEEIELAHQQAVERYLRAMQEEPPF